MTLREILILDAYKTRRTLFEKESTFVVENGSLVRSVAGSVAQQIALSDVRKISLTYQPLTMVERWVCSAETRSGRIWVPSASFVAPGQAVDQRQLFRQFVEELNRTIAATCPAASIAFVKGNNWSAYGSLVLLITMILMGLLLVFAAIGSVESGGGIISVGQFGVPAIVMVISSRVVWRIWRKNRRQTYDPLAIPADFASPLS